MVIFMSTPSTPYWRALLLHICWHSVHNVHSRLTLAQLLVSVDSHTADRRPHCDLPEGGRLLDSRPPMGEHLQQADERVASLELGHLLYSEKQLDLGRVASELLRHDLLEWGLIRAVLVQRLRKLENENEKQEEKEKQREKEKVEETQGEAG